MYILLYFIPISYIFSYSRLSGAFRTPARAFTHICARTRAARSSPRAAKSGQRATPKRPRAGRVGHLGSSLPSPNPCWLPKPILERSSDSWDGLRTVLGRTWSGLGAVLGGLRSILGRFGTIWKAKIIPASDPNDRFVTSLGVYIRLDFFTFASIKTSRALHLLELLGLFVS